MATVPVHPLASGDLVFAKMRSYPAWPARIDCIRPNRCPTRDQGNLPAPVNDPEFHWPIYFYGTHQIAWIPQKDIYHLEDYRDEFGKNPRVKDAMYEAMKYTWVHFQFGDGSNHQAWSPRHSEMAKAWFANQSDEVANETEWDHILEPPQKKQKTKRTVNNN
ncbi:Oidioi.mRNA.OKI2018_I69.XSR.g14710.t1.cds [Oikopleura dioica]|uniref:Oidioi.mRNA.OKI2018_I69.XSR.g14710.t1.cds n=1 Tax=Oikopleura dioica TaxID=34765 RepID=A0ABN7SAM8_OIKDI|nr:Oidioi.mRNA.OKI2018_I69.XSR.g14710.t1.cds [Oikopleura dioica]